MNITFQIHYNTQWGQQIAITGNSPQLGNGDPQQAFRLTYIADGIWQGTLYVDEQLQELQYKYLLVNNNHEVLREDWGDYRILRPKITDKQLFVKDTWRSNLHPETAFYTSAFQDIVFQPLHFTNNAPDLHSTSIQFQLHAPRVEQHCRLCITGNIPELGGWNAEKPLLMDSEHYPLWTAKTKLSAHERVEYKYGMYDTHQQKIRYVEAGENRVLGNDLLPISQRLIVTDEYFDYPIDDWKGAGVAIPVFSIRTQNGFGVGEFTDLQLMVDWAAKTGLKMVQILPVNDTIATHTWTDSYPYAAVSVFALHPLYLNVEEIDGFDTLFNIHDFQKEKEALNALEMVNYEQVMNLKLQYARQVFESQKAIFFKNGEVKDFLQQQGHWLKPYAAFCYLREKYGTPNFSEWKTYKKFTPAGLKRLTNPEAKHFDDIGFHYFLQYYLDRQLKNAADYARKKGIILKGDIAIGIYRHSADAWVAPELYNMDAQAGAPPDPFSAIGQNWGFPTYNWERMAEDGYAWWKSRFQQLSRYFDAFRIDHILGFFRIWEIPLDQVQGTMGYFNKALPIHRHEFAQRGIPFNYKRFCQPFLPYYLLQKQFGEHTDTVIQTFLAETSPGFFQFKPEFDTQRKIETYLAEVAHLDKAFLKEALFNLISNVLFFEVAGSEGKAFHPRIDFFSTLSYKVLDAEMKTKLSALYEDYFFHRQEHFWEQEAMKKLPAIRKATKMLICGEDLGMVPACVPGVMQDLGILSLEIQRMSKNPKTEFLQAADIPYLSVVSPSTHDMATIRGWWEEMTDAQRQRFYNRQLGLPGQPPPVCEPHIVQLILNQHLNWKGMWVVFPLQDFVAIDGDLRYPHPNDERINVPANPKHYWRYRFHLPMEDLMKEVGFNEKLKGILESSGR